MPIDYFATLTNCVMKNLLLYLTVFSIFFMASCGEEEPEEEPEPTIEMVVSAKIDEKDYRSETDNVSTEISNGNYRVTAKDLPQSFRIIVKGTPEVKKYILNGDLEESGAKVIWSSSNLTVDADHVIIDGNLDITGFEGGLLKGFFEGTARRVSEPYPTVVITKGYVEAKFPN